MEIREFDFRQAGPEEYASVSAFLDRLRAERDPHDPPIPLEERIRRWRHMPAHIGFQSWVIRHRERPEVIAEAELTVRRAEDNRHVADANVAVLPEFRRRGLGRRLLAPVADAAAGQGRTLLITTTHSTVPAGDAFMRALGATMGLPLHINQLELSESDPALLDRWQQRAAERATGFDLLTWEGPVPEEHLEAFASLIGAMNQAPRGDLLVEDFTVTPEHVRLHEQAQAARGDQRWQIVARERATGALVGYTEVIWHPNRPELLEQGDTAVLPTYQNRGLGRWLKARMLAKVLEARPQVRRIRTGNAFVNEPMLKINRELGFRPYRSMAIWQVEVSQVLTWLDQAGISPA